MSSHPSAENGARPRAGGARKGHPDPPSPIVSGGDAGERVPTTILVVPESLVGAQGFSCFGCSEMQGRPVFHPVSAVEIRDVRFDRVIECPVSGRSILCLADAS
jgi:hypothetical protein